MRRLRCIVVCLYCGLIAAPLSAQPINGPRTVDDTLVSMWELEESSGAATDSHRGLVATEAGGLVASTDGRIGHARDFEAADTAVLRAPNSADVQVGDEPWTIAAWVKAESLGVTRRILAKGSSNPDYQLAYSATSGLFLFQVRNAANTSSATVSATGITPRVGQWYFVLGWHDPDANTLNIQVDRSVRTTSYSGGIFTNTSTLAIGGSSDAVTQPWDGAIDGVLIFRGVLSDTDRAWLAGGHHYYALTHLLPDDLTKPRTIVTETPVTYSMKLRWDDPDVLVVGVGYEETKGVCAAFPDPEDRTNLGFRGYRVYAATTINGPWSVAADLPFDCSYQYQNQPQHYVEYEFTAGTPGVRYYFRVATLGDGSSESEPTEEASGIFPGVIP